MRRGVQLVDVDVGPGLAGMVVVELERVRLVEVLGRRVLLGDVVVVGRGWVGHQGDAPDHRLSQVEVLDVAGLGEVEQLLDRPASIVCLVDGGHQGRPPR